MPSHPPQPGAPKPTHVAVEIKYLEVSGKDAEEFPRLHVNSDQSTAGVIALLEALGKSGKADVLRTPKTTRIGKEAKRLICSESGE